jgi:uncharacterized protein with GYD domain
MAIYIVLSNFTDQGIKAVKDTTKRAEAFRTLAKKNGVTIKDLYWTLGSYDVVAIMDAPDEMTVTAIELSLAQAGNVRTQTMRGFSADEMGKILERVK